MSNQDSDSALKIEISESFLRWLTMRLILPAVLVSAMAGGFARSIYLNQPETPPASHSNEQAPP